MIEQSEGYKSLLKAIQDDGRSGRDIDERMEKLRFAVERAKHYENRTGVSASEILTAWEKRRDYWYMNYYQNANQPLLTGQAAKVFETSEELTASCGTSGFRCPNCNGVSRSPYECTSGIQVQLVNSDGKKETCNWKSYGLFGTLGKGCYVFVKDAMKGEYIFKPVAWETPVSEEATVAANR